MPPVLIVPGWMNSGPGHWQSLWGAAHPDFERVEQDYWESPTVGAWVARLDEVARATTRPPLLVAHSLGCLAVVHWALTRSPAAAAGALLVAPPDVEQADTPAPLRAFAPVPLRPLPFPATVVASRDDPYATFARAEAMASAWGAELVDAGTAGHLNTAAGYGPWPAGEAILRRLLARVA